MTSLHTAPVRWALAGYGFGGRIFHAPLIASAAGIQFVAVVTTDPDRQAAVASEHPTAVCVASLDELSALGVTGVTISTPPATHVPLARRAIELGLHVVVDKPFAPTARDAADLLRAAQHVRRQVIPYQNRRWDNDFRTLRQLVQAGRLGAVHRLTSRLDRCRPVKPGWPSDPAAGGGTLLDLGPHLIDQATLLLGPAIAVYAELDARRARTAAEDDVQMSLLHASGARSTLCAGLASPATGPRFLVQGARAGLRIEGFDIQEAQLKAGGSPRSLGSAWGADPGGAAYLTDANGTAETIPLDRGRWDTFYPAVAAAVQGEGRPPVDPRDAVATARVIDAARESARTGRVVTLAQGGHVTTTTS